MGNRAAHSPQWGPRAAVDSDFLRILKMPLVMNLHFILGTIVIGTDSGPRRVVTVPRAPSCAVVAQPQTCAGRAQLQKGRTVVGRCNAHHSAPQRSDCHRRGMAGWSETSVKPRLGSGDTSQVKFEGRDGSLDRELAGDTNARLP